MRASRAVIDADHPLHPVLRTLARLSLLAALAALLGYLGEQHWLLDLCAHFRWQYLLAMGAGLVAALLVRKRGIVVLLALVSLGNAWSLGSATGPSPGSSDALAATPAGRAGSWKLLVVNVHLDNRDLRPLLQLIEREAPDAVGIIELTPEAAAELAVLAQRYPVSRIEPRDDPFGIGLWSRLPASQVDLVSMPPLGFPALQLHWAAPDPGSLWLVHPFPPISGEATEWRDTQLRYTAGLIRGDEDAVLAGDLNATPWSSAYQSLRLEAGLVDSNADGWPWPTWFGSGMVSRVLAVPIDHVLHGSAWRTQVHRIGPDIGSDHRPLIVELARVR